VSELEVVTGRVEVVRLREAPEPRCHPDRKDNRSKAGRADPPPGAEPIAIRERGGPNGGAGPDVRGDHRREDKPGPEPAAGDEKISAVADESSRPQAERDNAHRVDDQKRQLKVQ